MERKKEKESFLAHFRLIREFELPMAIMFFVQSG
jgi:hypothetical protein